VLVIVIVMMFVSHGETPFLFVCGAKLFRRRCAQV
jgi:hypothetical protein